MMNVINKDIVSVEEKEQAIKNIIIALSDNTDSIGINSDRLDEICRSLNVLFDQAKFYNY